MEESRWVVMSTCKGYVRAMVRNKDVTHVFDA
jgi:hypothetical protein